MAFVACTAPCAPVQNPGPDTGSVAASISVTSGKAKLFGTLQTPRAPGPYPVVLIVAGSGPTDRDGNSLLLPGKNNSLRMLAEGLAQRGIASVRYDKRGIGESAMLGGNESDLLFTTYADDVAAWIELLRKDQRFDRVIVAGHSEGALLGTMAARGAGADALILIAGAGRPIAEVIREQLREAFPLAVANAADSILSELAQGKSVANVLPELQMVFRPSIQPYMMSWLPLDPAAELAKIKAPVLIVRGSTDAQAMRADALRLAEANKAARHVEIDGMNHVFKLVSGTIQEQMPSYSDPTLPVAPKLIDAVARFISDATTPFRN